MAPVNAPQMAGRGVVVHYDRLLLVRGDGDGTFWTLPGGRADIGEDARACVKREVYEETGLQVAVGPFFAALEFYDEAIKFHIIQMLFFATPEGAELPVGWTDQGGPVEEARFFTLEEVRALPKVTPEFLRLGEWLNPQDNNFYRGIEYRNPGQAAKSL